MKTTSFVTAAAALLLPTLTEGLVGIDWSVSKVPITGLKNITFPFSIEHSPHTTGFYFAQQFSFIGQVDVGYTGLQPRPNSNGQPIIHAVFSSFISGTTTSDGQCSSGADGGPGVSCSVQFSATYTNTYNLKVQNTGGTTWTGTAVDRYAGKRVHIGSYTLPAGTQGIPGGQAGFIEYYLWNDGRSHPCNTLPYAEVLFGNPITPGASGILGNAYEYGDCVGKVDFKSKKTEQDVQVKVGFK